MGNLLSIDFDYFFPNPEENGESDSFFDWGHTENWSTNFLAAIWETRGAAFLSWDRRLPQLTEEWRTFWDRFRIRKDAILYVSDSHMHAAKLAARNIHEVWLYDAHHDSGYGSSEVDKGHFNAEDWMIYYHMLGTDLHMRYPQWRSNAFQMEPEPLIELDRQFDDGSVPPLMFTHVHVCRSGAWVPPWLDAAFDQFLALAPVKRVQKIEWYARSWDESSVLEMAKLFRAQREMLKQKQQKGPHDFTIYPPDLAEGMHMG